MKVIWNYNNVMGKNGRSYIRKIRYAVQWAVFLMVLYAGYTFYLFTKSIEMGLSPVVGRSPSVEGFMPIGALMALKLWVTTGMFDPIHPAALVIFIGALLLAVLLKKSFCGWICPVGTLSEIVWKFGRKALGRNFKMHKYIDYPLRSLKYIIMAFFVYAIIIKMTPVQILGFLNTPYWKVSDIKLLRFFADMSTTTQVTLAALFVPSFFYKNFWCRYLCPYGGLLGVISLMSPVKIKRVESNCIDCGLCSKNCPSLLPVDKKEYVRSAECTGCLTCVSYCPAKDALDADIGGRSKIRPLVYASMVVVVFFGVILAARLTGHWHSSLLYKELINFMPLLDSLPHP